MNRRAFITLVGGAAAAWPLAALGKTQRIALVLPSQPLSVIAETNDEPLWQAFFEELRRLGYIGGQSLLIERYSGEGRGSPDLARDVVSRNPDVIIAIGNGVVLDFKAVTTTIPIVGVFAFRLRLELCRAWRGRAAISPGPLWMLGKSSGVSVFNCCGRWCRRRPDWRTSKREHCESSLDPW